jgi:hypothetical protein
MVVVYFLFILMALSNFAGELMSISFYHGYHWFNVRTLHIRHIRNDQQYALTVPLLYSIYWLLHVSVVACHHQGAS